MFRIGKPAILTEHSPGFPNPPHREAWGLSQWPRPLPPNKKHMTEKDPEGSTPARNGVRPLLIIANWAEICKTSLLQAWRIQPRRLTGKPIEAQSHLAILSITPILENNKT